MNKSKKKQSYEVFSASSKTVLFAHTRICKDSDDMQCNLYINVVLLKSCSQYLYTPANDTE